MIEVSAGIIRRRDGRVMICQRGPGRTNALLWEFPGGKREAGESAKACLCRELMEELSLPVDDVETLGVRQEGGIRFTFLTACSDAQPQRTEHAAVAFVQPSDLLGYAFCPADAPVAQMLALQEIRVKHFFWDFDGTLMDTYPATLEAFVRAAASLGVQVERAHALTLMKDTLTRCIHDIAEENGLEAARLSEALDRESSMIDLCAAPPLPGIPEALADLSEMGGVHYMATHRDRKALEVMRRAGLGGFFIDAVTGDQGFALKPAPDMLLHLMDKHGLPARQCMMIGDRPLDTEAGRNAGMLSCLLDPEKRFPEGTVCDLHITHISQLTALLSGHIWDA